MVTGWKMDLLTSVWSFLVVLLYVPSLWTKEVSTGRYGDCFRGDYINVGADEDYTIQSSGGDAYDTLNCEMKFKSTRNDRLCVSFITLEIRNCAVELQIFSAESSQISSPIGQYDCHTDKIPESLCSEGHYLTVLMTKKQLGRSGYDFKLKLMEYVNRDTFTTGANAVVSVGVVAAVIIGVLVMVAVIAVLIVCFCCKNIQYTLKYESKYASRTDETNVPMEPTAPPYPEDDPPPYTEQPVSNQDPGTVAVEDKLLSDNTLESEQNKTKGAAEVIK